MGIKIIKSIDWAHLVYERDENAAKAEAAELKVRQLEATIDELQYEIKTLQEDKKILEMQARKLQVKVDNSATKEAEAKPKTTRKKKAE